MDSENLTKDQCVQWAATARNNYRKGTLSSPEIIAACESIPGWSWSKHTFLSFAEARTFVRALGLRSQKEWYAYVRSKTKPPNIPAGPVSAYKGNGWIGWSDWLGTGSIHEKVFRAFADARAFARALGLKSVHDWEQYKERPGDIPANPAKRYKGDGWVNWTDWLGTEHIRGKGRRYYKVKLAGA